MLVLCMLFLAACSPSPGATEPTAPSATQATIPTVPETVPSESTSPVLHGPLYIPGLDVEDVILYFNEVCLDAEMTDGDDANCLQRWTVPITYHLNGSYTQEDLAVLSDFTQWLNTVEGFPGIMEAADPSGANLEIHFCTPEEMPELMGEGFTDMDGAMTFWYTDSRIHSAIICCRSDLSQYLRNSVLLEELYNSLGPAQDSMLRPDSIIYEAYSETQSLSQIDKLLLQLLYHPTLQPGMTAGECAAAIRALYY